MFKLDLSDSYSWPVEFEVPTDGGTYEACNFDAKIKRLKQERIDEINALGIDGILNPREIASELLIGWSGISKGGQEIPYSEEAKKNLLNTGLVASAILRAYFASLQGAKRKN